MPAGRHRYRSRCHYIHRLGPGATSGFSHCPVRVRMRGTRINTILCVRIGSVCDWSAFLRGTSRIIFILFVRDTYYTSTYIFIFFSTVILHPGGNHLFPGGGSCKRCTGRPAGRAERALRAAVDIASGFQLISARDEGRFLYCVPSCCIVIDDNYTRPWSIRNAPTNGPTRGDFRFL